jgi:glutamate dehydrogenase
MVADLAGRLGEVLDGERATDLARRAETLAGHGVPADLARAIAGLVDLVAAPALARIALAAKADITGVAKVYFAIGARLGFDWLRSAAGEVMAETAWQQRAVTAVIDDLHALQAELTGRVITAAGGLAGVGQLAHNWTERNRAALQRFDALLAEMRMATMIDVAALTVALRELRALAG